MTEPEWTDSQRMNGYTDAWRKRQAAKEEKTVHLSDETVEKLADAIARRSSSLTVDADAIARAVKSALPLTDMGGAVLPERPDGADALRDQEETGTALTSPARTFQPVTCEHGKTAAHYVPQPRIPDQEFVSLRCAGPMAPGAGEPQ